MQPTPAPRYRWSVKLAALAFSLALPFVLLEIVLRFLPVHDSLRAVPVNDANPIARYEPNLDFTFSSAWDFKIVNHGHTNNYGFVNAQDYDPKATSPLLAVVGDSFVESLMVPYEQTLQGRLAQAVGKNGRVYSFGMGRSALSQYLAYAKFARETFHPDGLVITIVANDYDESYIGYDTAPWEGRLHYYQQDAAGEMHLVRKDYAPKFFKRFLREFALPRYLYLNLQAPQAISDLKTKSKALFAGLFKPTPVDPKRDALAPLAAAPTLPQYIGNTASSTDPTRVRISRQCVDAFFRDLPAYSGLPASKIVFVVDAVRPHIYSEKERRLLPKSFVGMLRSYFLGKARAHGYQALDLEPTFLEAFLREGTRFEFPTDNHWNGTGHAAAASAVLKTKLFSDVFARSR